MASSRLSGAEVKLGKALFDQQLWCFGQDIRAPGNLLLACGMEQHRPPRCVPGGPQYLLQRPDLHMIALWGFGAVIRHPEKGALLLRRYTFSPRYRTEMTLPYAAWTHGALPPFARPRDADALQCMLFLLRALLDWFSEYETWVLQSAGAAHRENCLRNWHRKQACDPQRIPDAWRCLVDAVDALQLPGEAPCT